MHLYQILFPLLQIVSFSWAHDPKHCTAYDSCWPSPAQWDKFNASIGGRLLVSRPSAAVCHQPEYNKDQCEIAKENWKSSDWRTAQPGAYSAILWELGPDACFINSSVESTCAQGLVADYTVNASSIEIVQKAVKWAAKKSLYLTVKNTGHDHLGRSSGKGAFAIWTHYMKGRTWRDRFVPKGAPKGLEGVKAVTLYAGEQWLDVYGEADRQGRIVVGGSARTVGAAGGWLTGGGHSAWSYFYGLGVDNLLEVDVVTASGEHKTLNQYTHKDHFWAIRGGGGNSWGIITSVTYNTFPPPTHINTVFAQYTANNTATQHKILGRVFQALVAVTDAGYTGYGTLGTPVGLILIQPNGTNVTTSHVTNLLNEIGSVSGVEMQIGSFNFPSWIEYCNAFLQDPNIATNIIDPSRLLTADVLMNKTEQLLDIIADFPELSPGFNFIGKVNSRYRDQTSVHETWKSSRALFSMGVDWPDDIAESEKRRRKLRGIEVSTRLAAVVGKGSGTYVNEANPYEPYWQDIFWGKRYNRLQQIKREIDPDKLFDCNRCVGGDIVYSP